MPSFKILEHKKDQGLNKEYDEFVCDFGIPEMTEEDKVVKIGSPERENLSATIFTLSRLASHLHGKPDNFMCNYALQKQGDKEVYIHFEPQTEFTEVPIGIDLEV